MARPRKNPSSSPVEQSPEIARFMEMVSYLARQTSAAFVVGQWMGDQLQITRLFTLEEYQDALRVAYGKGSPFEHRQPQFIRILSPQQHQWFYPHGTEQPMRAEGGSTLQVLLEWTEKQLLVTIPTQDFNRLCELGRQRERGLHRKKVQFRRTLVGQAGKTGLLPKLFDLLDEYDLLDDGESPEELTAFVREHQGCAVNGVQAMMKEIKAHRQREEGAQLDVMNLLQRALTDQDVQ